MATVFRKTYTQPLPRNYEIVERHGKKMIMWHDRRGRRHYDEMTVGRRGQTKIVRQSPTWFARYRDVDGTEQIETTNCRDEQAARQVLANIVKRVEHRKAGIISPEEHHQATHARQPILRHVAEYLEHLAAKTVRGRKVSVNHRKNFHRHLHCIIADCGFRRLADITCSAMEKWMNRYEKRGMGARTRNMYRAAMVGFCNWCVETQRLPVNPLMRVCKADEHADRRRTRRALTTDEITRLLKAARLRPVAELGRPSEHTQNGNNRRTWRKAELTYEILDDAYTRGCELLRDQPNRLEELHFIGRQRELMYKTMILTGLRKGELASLTIGQLYLDAQQPYAELLPTQDKAGRGATIPLRKDLAAELKKYIALLENTQKPSRQSRAGTTSAAKKSTTGITATATTSVAHEPHDAHRKPGSKVYESRATDTPAASSCIVHETHDGDIHQTPTNDNYRKSDGTGNGTSADVMPRTRPTQTTKPLPADTPLFHVPSGFIRIFDRDLAAAGIAKHDDRGRTVDIHALRHTFGTHLSLAGVAPRVASNLPSKCILRRMWQGRIIGLMIHSGVEHEQP